MRMRTAIPVLLFDSRYHRVQTHMKPKQIVVLNLTLPATILQVLKIITTFPKMKIRRESIK